MRVLIIITFLFLAGCNKTTDSEYGSNIVIVNEQDTVNLFYQQFPKGYVMFDHQEVDSVLTSASSSEALMGTFMVGVRNERCSNCRYLAFNVDSGYAFEDFANPRSRFLSDEYDIDNYRVELITDYIDSTETPVSLHHLLAAIDNTTNDTLLYQETIYSDIGDNLIYTFIAYQNEGQRTEMHDIFLNLLTSAE